MIIIAKAITTEYYFKTNNKKRSLSHQKKRSPDR